MSQQPALTADQQKLSNAWEEHLLTEFNAHNADQKIATMVANPRVNAVPLMIGGDGKEELHEFYAKYFLPQISSRYGDGPGVADHRPGEAGRRNGLPGYPYHPNGLDLAWHPADRQAGRDSDARGRAIYRRQAGARALVLGPSLGTGAGWAPATGMSASRRGRGRAISARSEHTIK
jgi:hypothetical protein